MRYLNVLLLIFCSLSSSLFSENTDESEKISQFDRQIELLEKENRLQEAELKKEKLAFSKQKDPLEMQQALDRLKLNQTLATAEARYQEISTQNKLLQAEQAQKQANLKAELETLKLTQALADQKHSEELIKIKQEKERIAYQNSKLSELNKQYELQRKQAQNALLAERADLELKLSQMEAELKYITRQEQWKKRVVETVPYPQNPLNEQTLTISDRRIQLNDAIIKGSADYVCERIHYFNNKSKTDPIFIVIDRCPGGSGMEGARIVQAIKTSIAPIHVVVKSYAASMAAIILAQADHSYAFPNAFVLHHQPSSTPKYGNITQQSERTELMKKWATRLHAPVAKKMGIDLDAFYEQMYANNSDGDWLEFADKAVELKWVDHLVEAIREEGIIEQPSSQMPMQRFRITIENQQPLTNGLQMHQVMIPQPEPFDYYFLYDPDQRYIW